MTAGLSNIFRLGVKEIYSLARDPVMMGLIIYSFSLAIYSVANGVQTELRNAAIAIVDEDHSVLSERIKGAFLRPQFKDPVSIGLADVDAVMDRGQYSFVLDVPPGFQADVLAGRVPALQLNVDATAMTLAGTGSAAVANIIQSEVLKFVARSENAPDPPVRLAVHTRYNPNLNASWFLGVTQIISNLTILSIILAGAAVIREREHGTIEHLLVMPVTPAEIMVAKIWANGLVIVVAAFVSLNVMVRGALGVPVAGSGLLFVLGTAVYVFSVTSLGIMLSTIATTMPQFGLLSIPVFVVLNLLSGSMTPLESMPPALQVAMQFSPATHFVSYIKSLVFRDAGLAVLWPHLAAIGAIGALLFVLALVRFRSAIAAIR